MKFDRSKDNRIYGIKNSKVRIEALAAGCGDASPVKEYCLIEIRVVKKEQAWVGNRSILIALTIGIENINYGSFLTIPNLFRQFDCLKSDHPLRSDPCHFKELRC